jgi:protein associated with RNAse G/E
MKTWQPGEAVALRGMYNQKPWYIQSARVVKDTAEEIALLVMPGAECAAPVGYIQQKHGNNSHWELWQEVLSGNWKLEKYDWHTNRFLILLEPQKYYASIYIWNQASGTFECYYINFQLPFVRSHCGFDTYDLELDIVIDPDYQWHWKDVDDYHEGIRMGVLRPEWVQGIEQDQKDVFERIKNRKYPLNAHWLNWRPDATWTPPQLPLNWDK